MESDILECRYALVDYFRGGATRWAAAIRDSLLRTDWRPSSRSPGQRTKKIRRGRALPVGGAPKSASNWFHPRRDPAAVLWLSERHPTLSALEKTVAAKTCRA